MRIVDTDDILQIYPMSQWGEDVIFIVRDNLNPRDIEFIKILHRPDKNLLHFVFVNDWGNSEDFLKRWMVNPNDYDSARKYICRYDIIDHFDLSDEDLEERYDRLPRLNGYGFAMESLYIGLSDSESLDALIHELVLKARTGAHRMTKQFLLEYYE